MPDSSPQQLLFVYNADAGVLNGLKDLVHKIVSPRTYACDLCAITYDFAGMRTQWKEAVAALPLPASFLHRDEFRKVHPMMSRPALPAVFTVDAAGQLVLLISAAEMKPLALEGLIALVRVRTAATVMR